MMDWELILGMVGIGAVFACILILASAVEVNEAGKDVDIWIDEADVQGGDE